MIKNLDEYMPIANWDLLPMDKYRAHNWHCFTTNDIRTPYAAIYTSLGCPYSCEFCCINAPFGKSGIRYRSPEIVVAELEMLNLKYNVKNIKIIDEMFVLHEQHYMRIVDLIIEKKLDLNIWCYARVDTIKEENLKRMKIAGINWLALGIESANPNVRDGAHKKLKVNDIKTIINLIRKHDINIIGNFIFGLPDDTLESMRETLDMAKELNCEFVNFYCAMAYPGSRLYNIAIQKNWKLPETWIGFSQHSYDMLPLPSNTLSARDIVAFRDNAFNEYFSNNKYLTMIENKFGKNVRENLENICKNKLRRKILEENI
ncbi:radical SAM protein [Campylobacter jejuni]|nr:radical SAM protein [Campylobacter jejuni]